MANESFMDRIRNFLGYRREPPINDFRNPIWLSDDEDDNDELFNKQNMDIFTDPARVHEEFMKHMQEMFKSFGNMLDTKIFMNGDPFECPDELNVDQDNSNTKTIRDYYLKPGYHQNMREEHPKQDIDLDGKISSNDISGLLKQNDDNHKSDFLAPYSGNISPFSGNMIPGRSYCKTIITTSVTKPDGTMETKQIIKNSDGVIEETTTTTIPNNYEGPSGSNIDAATNTNLIYSSVMSELSSLFKNFY